ncbi:unnamed protein product [Sphacelaria rigidula]
MLGTNSNIYFDKENRVGQQQARQKLRKGLSHAGKGSENTLPVKATPGKQQGTGLSVSNPNKLKFGAGSVKPLGSRNENAAAATGKGKGISLVKNVGGSGSKPMQHQRKKLGDISNRDRAPAAGGSGGGAMGGELHLQAKGAAGSKGSLPGKDKATSAFKSGLKAPAPRVTRPLLAERSLDSSLNRGDVADVELAMGRLGDEEEVLVRRRNEQRAAMAMSNAFRSTKSSRDVMRGKRTKIPSSSSCSPRASCTASSRSLSDHNHGTGSAEQALCGVSGMLTEGRPSRAEEGTQDAADEQLQRAIDRLLRDDFEEILGQKVGSAGDGLSFNVNEDVTGDVDWLASDLEGVGSLPVSPLEDDNFLTQDLDFTLV